MPPGLASVPRDPPFTRQSSPNRSLITKRRAVAMCALRIFNRRSAPGAGHRGGFRGPLLRAGMFGREPGREIRGR